MPITHSDRGKARKYSDEDIARMEAMKSTMTNDEIAAAFGVCRRVIEKQLDEHGTPSAYVYKPRVLAPWPAKADFANDNIDARD